jgi:hypothetical protein
MSSLRRGGPSSTIDRNNRLTRHGWTFQRAGSSGAQVHLWSFNAGQPGKPRRQRTDRDGAARLLVYDVHVHVGVDLRVPVEAFALDSQMGRLLSGLQLAETMPTYVESHRPCCAREYGEARKLLTGRPAMVLDGLANVAKLACSHAGCLIIISSLSGSCAARECASCSCSGRREVGSRRTLAG